MANAKPVRLMIIGHSGQEGGAEFCLDVFLQHLRRERFVPCLLFACDGPMVSAARDKGYRAEVAALAWWLGYENSVWYWKNLLRSPFRIAKLSRQLKSQNVDVVYTNSAVVFEGAIAARRVGIPHVWHVHEFLTTQFWTHWLSLKTICRCIDRWSEALLFESKAAEETFINVLSKQHRAGYAPRYIVPNPVRLGISPPDRLDRQRSRTLLGLDDTHFVVLWVGQFIERKNPDLMVAAFSQAQFKGHATLVMLGDGVLRPSIKEKATRLASERKRVLLPGFRRDISLFLEAADVLVLTSQEESFGMVIVEAGAAGLPCIATRCGGPQEIIEHAVNGFLVHPEDFRAIAEHLEQLERNPGLRSSIGRAARQKVQHDYSPERYTRAIEDILLKVSQQMTRHE